MICAPSIGPKAITMQNELDPPRTKQRSVQQRASVATRTLTATTGADNTFSRPRAALSDPIYTAPSPYSQPAEQKEMSAQDEETIEQSKVF
jgi:hypothetical protein